MNKPPEILVNSGFVTDANGVLTEMVIPSNVVTQNMPSIITTYATTINWLPSNASTLVELNANVIVSLTSGGTNQGNFRGYTKLTKVSMPSLDIITLNGGDYSGQFYGCTNLTIVNMPNLTAIKQTNNNGGVFYNCTSLQSINLPKLDRIEPADSAGYYSVFGNCTGLKTATLPVVRGLPAGGTSTRGVFSGCTGLESVQLGSEGHPVSSIGSYAFGGCTQTGLTITIYTSGGASLAGEPWGATNATIEYEEA